MKLKDLKQFKCYRIVGTDIEFVYLDRRGNPDIGCPRCMVIKHPDPNNYNYGDFNNFWNTVNLQESYEDIDNLDAIALAKLILL